MGWAATSFGLLLWAISEGHSLSVFEHHLTVPDKLYIYPWKIFPDMVVLDWYIRLRDKDRMVGCDLSYGPETGGNTTTVENFLPLYRSISLHHLTSNTEYWVHLVCRDIQGELHASDTVNFTTGIATLREPQLAAVQVERVVQTERLNRGMLSSRPSKAVSPHVVMGISCIILSLVVLMVSSVIVVNKYKASGKTMEAQLEQEGVATDYEETWYEQRERQDFTSFDNHSENEDKQDNSVEKSSK